MSGVLLTEWFIRTCDSIIFKNLRAVGSQGGGGGTLIFSYIRRLGSFLGFRNLNFNSFWGFQKNEYFWGHHKIGLYLGVISMYFNVFS